jgi:superfamily II DNA or RNA helicase
VPDAEVLFASIQTLGRQTHLQQFARARFDYILVDEFHHAATYRRLIDHFEPRFLLLGLTATPEGTDRGNLLVLCPENLGESRNTETFSATGGRSSSF